MTRFVGRVASFFLSLACSCHLLFGIEHAHECFSAILDGQLEKVRPFIEAHPEMVHHHDREQNTALHLACCATTGGDKHLIIQYLIEKGADVNQRNGYQSAPLHIAIFTSNYPGALLLLKVQTLDPNCRDHLSCTPLHYALFMRNLPLLRLLLSHPRVDVNAGTREGLTPLHCAAMLGYEEETALLLEDPRVKPDVEMTEGDSVGATPLHLAALCSRVGIVRLLTQKKVKVNAEISQGTYKGFTPMHFSVIHSSEEEAVSMIKMLYQKGGKVDRLSQSGHSPASLTDALSVQQCLRNPSKDPLPLGKKSVK